MTIDGNWSITINSPMGAQKSELTLKTDGDVLTGTNAGNGPGGPSKMALEDGKVEGNSVSWSNSIKMPFPMTMKFKGTVEGDTITGTVAAGAFGTFKFSGSRN